LYEKNKEYILLKERFGYGEYKHSSPNFENQRKPKSALDQSRVFTPKSVQIG